MIEKQTRVLVVGSVNADTFIHVDEFPSRHETVLGWDASWAVGGKGGNQAISAARAGADVTFVASIGDDQNADASLEVLRCAGIDTDRVTKHSGKATGTAVVFVDRIGDNMIAVAPGANELLTSGHVASAVTADEGFDVALFQMEVPFETISSGLKRAKSRGIFTILNPAPFHKETEALLSDCDLVTPNQAEAEGIVGYAVSDWRTAASAAGEIVALGAGAVIITLGSLGCLVHTPQKTVQIPIFDVGPAIDTTGAGDVFNGALAVAIGDGKDLVEAARFAAAASALSVKVRSASGSAPMREEIDRLQADKSK